MTRFCYYERIVRASSAKGRAEMKKTIPFKAFTLFLMVWMLFMTVGPAKALGPFTDSWEEPVDVLVYNPCNDEWVWLTGSMHILYHDNLTPSGRLHWETRISYHNVRGLGLTSGKTYIGVGVDQGGGSTIVSDHTPYHYQASSQTNMSLVGPGRLENYKVFMNFHLTVTPDFEWRAYFENFRLACR
jgi:hypothetical protein